MLDLFALLGLPQDATTQQVEVRLARELETWQRRATDPDPAWRQEADRRLRLLGEARAMLLDDARRAAYLAGLRATQAAPQPRQPTAYDTDPLGAARRQLDDGDYAAAAHTARQVRDREPGSAEAWSLLSRAHAALGDAPEALRTAREAVRLQPGNPHYHFDQGAAHERLGQLDDARRCYEEAVRLDPVDDAPKLAVAAVLAQGDAPERMLPQLEDIHTRGHDPAASGAVLAGCLLRVAERVPRRREGHRYVVTSRREVDAMERLLYRARQVTADLAILHEVGQVEGYVRWCRARHLRELGRRGGIALAAAAVLAVVALYLLASLVLGPAGWKAVLLLVCLAYAAGFAAWWYAPGWATNRSARRAKASPEGEVSARPRR